MKALISGQAGLAVVVDGDHVVSIDAGTHRRITRSAHEWPYIFSDSSDVCELSDVSEADIVRELDLAWHRDRGLHLLLMLLDPEADRKVRRESAGYLEQFVTDALVLEYLRNRLHVAPLPESADLPGALRIAKKYQHRVISALLDAISEEQPAIRNCRQAWDILPPDLFGSSAEKEAFGFRAVENGLFTAVSSGKEVNHSQFSASDDRLIGKRWRREIRALQAVVQNRPASPRDGPRSKLTALKPSARTIRRTAFFVAVAASMVIAIVVKVRPVAAAEFVRIEPSQPNIQVVVASQQGLQHELNGGLGRFIPRGLRSSANREAERLFESGENHAKAGRLREAAAAFRESNASYSTLAAELNEAVALLNSFQLAQAERLLLSALPEAEHSDVQLWYGAMLSNLGNIYRVRGQLDEAEKMYSRALETDRKNGFITGEAGDVYNLSQLLWDRGKSMDALSGFKRSLSISERAGVDSTAASSRLAIAMILAMLQRFPEAESNLKSVSAYFAERASPVDKAYYYLTSAQYLVSQNVAGQDYSAPPKHADQILADSRQALDLYRYVGNPSGEAQALLGIGMALRTKLTSSTDALDDYQEALMLSAKIGDISTQARALGAIGGWYFGIKAYGDAGLNLRMALSLYQQIGAYGSQCAVLESLASLMALSGHKEDALTYARQSVDLATKFGDAASQAFAYDDLGWSLYKYSGQTTDAIAALERAYALYSEVDSPARELTMLLIDEVKRSAPRVQ